MIPIISTKNALLYISLFLLSIITGCSSSYTAPIAENGVFTLNEEWNQQEEIINLSGEWDFYWNVLSPQTISDENPSTIPVPAAWNNIGDYSNKGYGVYHLKLKGLNKETLYGFKIPYTASSFDFWVNEDKLHSGGRPGVTKQSTTPSFKPEEVYVKPQETEIDLYIAVANFHHRDAGLVSNIKFGTAAQIIHASKTNLAFEAILIGSLILAGLYHLVLYIHRKKEKKLLLFGATCLIISTRILVIGEQIIAEYFPFIPWEVLVKVEYLTFFTVVPLFTWFLHLLYPQEVSNRFCKILSYASVPFIMVVSVTNASVFTHFLYGYQVITMIALVYLVFCLMKALYRNREGAMIVFLCAAFYALTVINDMLHNNRIIETMHLSGLGLFVFIFSQSYIIARNQSEAFGKVENYSKQLKEFNRTLESRIHERTESLELSKLELQKANNMLQRLSYYDQLTQIPNRRYFEETFDQYWKETRLADSNLALLYLDIDHFKLYNDSYGHQKGDQTLFQVAKHLEKVIEKYDGFVARMGGEEFVAILKDKTLDQIKSIGEQCRTNIYQLEIPHEQSLTDSVLTISIGGTLVSHPVQASQIELIHAADTALYRVKETGRNKCVILRYEEISPMKQK